MPHALAVRHVTVNERERVDYLARLTERRASATVCGTNFWAFEREGTRGQFIEFIETHDRPSLETALAQDTLFSESLDFRIGSTSAEQDARTNVYIEIALPNAS